jgi:serine/threonine protein phosphatase 1
MVSAQHGPGATEAHHEPAIEAGRRLYAIGDIHGEVALLDALHARIIEDARDAECDAVKVFIYVGDYVDRGPDSRAVVEMVARSGLTGFETVHLKGNHEDMMLRFLDGDRDIGSLWLFNGGAETLESYGVTAPSPSNTDGLAAARAELARLLPAAHLDFLRGLRRWYRDGDYLFVHAGVRAGVALDDQRDEDLMWIREGFLERDQGLGGMVVHGHTPTAEPDLRVYRIGIDTGAFFSGRLTCLVLEGTSRCVLST